MLRITSGGSTKNLESFLDRVLKDDIFANTVRLAQRGVEALRHATPVESGLTADSWEYEIKKEGEQYVIWFNNTNTENGFHVAIGLQYGHGTGSGGWVQGIDYINPALKPIFDEMVDAVWKEVQRA